MNSVYYANGHGEQIFDEVVKKVKTFILPEGCYVITTTVCGKTADVDSGFSMKELLEPPTLELLQKISKDKEAEIKETLSYAFAMSGDVDELHMRYPGDKVGDITFYPSPYHPDGVMEMPPGLLDLKKLSEKQNIIESIDTLNCSEDIFYATTYPPKFDCSGMTLEHFDEKLMEHTIPISELIKKTGPGFYILPICRSIPQRLRGDPDIKRERNRQRIESFGGKKTKRTFRNKNRTSSRKRRLTKKRQSGKR